MELMGGGGGREGARAGGRGAAANLRAVAGAVVGIGERAIEWG